MKYYLAYGSNLHMGQMAFRCPDAKVVGSANISGYGLVFRRGYLTIEPQEGAYVPVGIWKITAADEKALDRYEGFPKFYYKENFFLPDGRGGTRVCMAYIMADGHPIREPSELYLNTVLEGYRSFGFDQAPLLEAVRYAKIHTTDSTTIYGSF